MKATNCPVAEARCAVKSLVEQSVRASNPLCAEKKKVEAAMLVVSDTTRPVSENRGANSAGRGCRDQESNVGDASVQNSSNTPNMNLKIRTSPVKASKMQTGAYPAEILGKLTN